MGKKKQYDKEALNNLRKCIAELRNPLPGAPVVLPAIDFDSPHFEDAVRKLPINFRKSLEKYFGLDGSFGHFRTLEIYKNFLKLPYYQRVALVQAGKAPKGPDASIYALQKTVTQAFKMLCSVEYLRMYDDSFNAICDSLLRKCSRKEVEYLTDTACLKYLLVYLIVIYNGPNMCFDQQITDPEYFSQDSFAVFDTYSFFKETLKDEFSSLEDNSINIALIKYFLDNLKTEGNPQAMVEIMQMVGLNVPNELRSLETATPIEFFKDIRELKESLFPRGPWKNLEILCKDTKWAENGKLDFSKFLDAVKRYNWVSYDYPVDHTVRLVLKKKKKEFSVYHIGNLKFSDINELIFIYLAPPNIF